MGLTAVVWYREPESLVKGSLPYELILRLRADGFTQSLSGMAEAVDTWSALSVLALREENPALNLYCVLPCEGQADKWTASSQELYRSVLDRADSIVYVSRTYHKDCMLDRNRFLVDHAATLLAVYNGERRGGTAAAVRYAQKMGREIIMIDPLTQALAQQQNA